MKKLTEAQFHTIWTIAAEHPKYDKQVFMDIERELREKNLLLPLPAPFEKEELPIEKVAIALNVMV